MNRAVINVDLRSRTRRMLLPIRNKPYWMALNEGAHLGYYRGQRVRKWVARFRQPGGLHRYQEATMAEADDNANADGQTILNFKQTQTAARYWFASLERTANPVEHQYTISDALDNYLARFTGKDVDNTRRRIEAIIRPQMGHHPVVHLTPSLIADWHLQLAKAPARLRTAPGAVQNYRQTADTADARRSRRSSANHILTILKAALNVAYRNEKIADDNAWRRVRTFAKADAPRLRSMGDDESRRLVSACNVSSRPMVMAALLTGARCSELAALEVRDFDPQSRSLWLRDTNRERLGRCILKARVFDLYPKQSFAKVGPN